VKVRHDEGVANPIRPEPCDAIREGCRSVGRGAHRPAIEPRKLESIGPTWSETRKAQGRARQRELPSSPAWSFRGGSRANLHSQLRDRRRIGGIGDGTGGENKHVQKCAALALNPCRSEALFRRPNARLKWDRSEASVRTQSKRLKAWQADGPSRCDERIPNARRAFPLRLHVRLR